MRREARTTLLFCLLCTIAAGCHGDEPPAIDDSGAADASADASAIRDAGVEAPPPPADVCDELGLVRRPFDAAGTGTDWGDVAGDFTLETLDGTFSFASAWSGCESYVFIDYFESKEGDTLFRTFPDPLFERSTHNVRYFFASYETAEGAARARVETMRESVEEALSFLAPEDAERWRARVHYVTTPLPDVTGSVGDLIRAHGSVQFAFGIDRAQRFDPVGSLAEVVGGGFVPRIGMAAWASRWYEQRARLDARLAAEPDAVVVPLVDEADLTDRVLVRDAMLPDAATLSTFDALDVDVTVLCRADPSACSEWDRIASVALCTDDTCADTREIARWITPYARPGERRWLIDATPFLGVLAEGGAQRFRVELGPDFEEPTARDVHISLRFRATGAPDRAFAAELAWRGGAFDATYAAAHPPFAFTPPPGTRRVELVSLLSGHGQTAGDNCAEWCNHEHALAITGGATHRIDFPSGIGAPYGCAERVDDGVVPGQYGNWAPARAGWCPGAPVDPVRFDVTDDVDLAGPNEATYSATFRGGAPRGGDIDLSVYVVYFR